MKQDDNLRAQIMVLAFVEHEGSMIFVSDKNIDQIMQKIASYIDTVIGEDEDDDNYNVPDDNLNAQESGELIGRQGLRAEQRRRAGI